MAEYASAIMGIAAFGLQICNGLINYYDTYKTQDRAIARLIQDVRTLHDLLAYVNESLQNENSINIRQGINSSIEDIVQACDEVLNELAVELDKVRLVTAGKDKSISDSLIRGVRRLKYPFKESTLIKLRESIDELKENLSLAFEVRQSISLQTLAHRVDDIRDSLQSLRNDRSKTEALKWLHAPDPWDDLHIISRKKHEGTGLWLIEGGSVSNQRFRNWMHSNSATFLWIVGFAGTGKSVLASSIIQHVASTLPKGSAVSFFFFNFRDRSKQSSAGLIKSLVRQLSSQTEADLLEQFYTEHQYRQPSQNALLKLYVSLTGLFEHIYIVVDAIDECPVSLDRYAVIETLDRIKAISNVHLMVLSRDEVDIRQGLQAAANECISLRNSDVQDDIQLFVREYLITNTKLAKWKSYHAEIENVLSKQSNGMFRWVECQFVQLEQCKTLNALQKSLYSLPSTLNQTYDRIVASFDQTEKAAILRALMFLCFSSRSLLACELIDAMAVQPGNAPAFDIRDRIQDVDDLFNMLPGLLSLTPFQNINLALEHGPNVHSDSASVDDRNYYTIHFAHASVKDYFLSGDMAPDLKDFHLVPAFAHKAIAQSLLAYTLNTSERYHSMRPEERPVDIYPFAVYAIEDLASHLKQCNDSITLLDDIVKIFRGSSFRIRRAINTPQAELYIQTPNGNVPTRDPRYCNAVQIPNTISIPSLSSLQQDLLCAAMFLVEACVVDLAMRVVSQLIAELEVVGHDVEYTSNLVLWLLSQVDSFTEVNNRDMCRALVNTTSIEHPTNGALYQAMLCRHAYWGDIDTVVKLLPKDGGSTSGLVMNPIDITDLGDRLEGFTRSTAMDILLASLQSRTSSPFCCALEGRQWTLVQYFLDNGCLDWCKQSPQGQLALDIAMYAAVEARSLDHVRLLLSKGADVAYKDTTAADFTALYRAAVIGEVEIVGMLLDYGADANACTRFGNTSLHLASRRQPEVARLLVDRGADLTLTNHLGLTCLHFAALRSRTDTIEYLLNAGADPFRRNVAGLTPKELLMIHLHKWTGLWGLQVRGSASLQALEEGEKKWLEHHKISAATNELSKAEDDKHDSGKIPENSAQRGHESGSNDTPLADQQIQLDDVVDIFIEVPQIPPKG